MTRRESAVCCGMEKAAVWRMESNGSGMKSMVGADLLFLPQPDVN